MPTSLPVADVPGVDARLLGLAGLITAVTALGFGLVPALRAAGARSLDAIRSGPRAGHTRGAERLRSGLVVAEVAASVVLLVTAGLMIQALWRVQQIDPGFRTDGVLTMRTALPMPAYRTAAAKQQFYDRVLGEVRALPGVSSAAYISFLPMVMTRRHLAGDAGGPGRRSINAPEREPAPGDARVLPDAGHPDPAGPRRAGQ